MKFIIENSNKIGQQKLLYLIDECSFYMKYTGRKIDMELIINKISLAVSDDKIVDLSGFCGLDKTMKSSHEVPAYEKGILKVEPDLKYGLAYSINNDDWPVYLNVLSGWVCIGDPSKSDNATEFINNCVAVIDDNSEFVSLWLRPQSLPNF